MDPYMHKSMVSIVSLEKIEIMRVYAKQSKAKIFEKKKIILGPKTAILASFLVVREGGWAPGAPPPLLQAEKFTI